MSHLYEPLNQPEGYWLRDLIILLLLFGVLFLGGLGSAPLIDPDEGRYAEIPREMLEKNDFVTPTLNYVKYFEKPPLLYWVNAASISVFGQNEFAARLPSALSGLFSIILTYIAGRNFFDRKTAITAALILGSCAGFMMQSRIILTDMLLTLCLTGSMFSFLLATRSRNQKKEFFFYLFFIFSSLAVLTKGLIGMVLPGGIIFWYLVLSGQWRLLREIPWFSGLLLFLAVAAPWFVLVSMKNPEFPHFFFIHEHFQRYTSAVHNRSQPFWFFIPILILTFFPWSFFLAGSLKKGWQERYSTKTASLFLLIWPVVIIFFFSLSSSKLIPYILPTFPPLALLTARAMNAQYQSRQPDSRIAQSVLALLLLITGGALALLPLMHWLPPYLHKTGQLGREIAAILNASGITLQQTVPAGLLPFSLGILLLWTFRTRSARLLIAVLCLFGVLLEIILPYGFNKFAAERLSSRSLAKAFLANADSRTIIAQSAPRQGMNFYTGKRLITVEDADELTFGSRQGNQQGWFLTQEEFYSLWRSEKHVMIVVPRHEASLYDSSVYNIAPRKIADNGSLLLISNR